MEGLTAQLTALLCPHDQRVTPHQLAARLRDVAAALDSSGSGAAEQTVPAQEVPPPCDAPDATAGGTGRGKGAERKLAGGAGSFDISRYPQRLVALEVFYAGWHYHGFATQGDGPGSAETVETHLFAALKATRLVAPDATWSGVEYSRCGRTDAGVSALRQMVVLRCRSSGTVPELDYVGALNRQLPDDIRVLTWRPAPAAFSARFNAKWRQYKYLFWNDGLDVAAMRDAASRLVGTHDFRNLCKMDVDAVCNFVRRIEAFTVDPEGEGAQQPHQPGGSQLPQQGRLWAFNVTGTAFLWHQVRCMAALLLLVGRRAEAPSVIDALLDVAALPGKPAYEMAPEEPLLLFACGYDHGDGPGQLPALPGPTPQRSLSLVVDHLRAQTRLHAVRSQMFGHALQVALQASSSAAEQPGASPPGPAAASRYVPLLQRTREATFEEQVARRAPGKIKWMKRQEEGGHEADEALMEAGDG